MLKKGLSFILALVICLSAMAVLPTAVSAKALATPKITGLTSTANGVKLTWGRVTGGAKYRAFIKTSSGWVKLGDTKGTSWTYTKAKSGKTYTFTVRCLSADGKKFTSSFNKTGWKIKYRKPADWSKLYQDYVMNKRYMPYVQSSFKNGYHAVFLYDADFDGTPELFVNTGYMAVANWHEVFTIKNGSVTYLFRQPMFYTFSGSAPKSKYKGFFTFGGHSGYAAFTYCYIKNGKWKTETVMELLDDSSTTPVQHKVKSITKNKGLYDAFIAATKKSSSGYRDFLYPGRQYEIDQIKKIGWNAFLKQMGY